MTPISKIWKAIYKTEDSIYSITTHPQPERVASTLLNKWCGDSFLDNLPLFICRCSFKLKHINGIDYQCYLLDEDDAPLQMKNLEPLTLANPLHLDMMESSSYDFLQRYR